MKKHFKYGLIFIPLLLGIIVSLNLDFNLYKSINKPLLAPPKIVFPIVWSIMYLLLGIVLYRVRQNKKNLYLFILQLFINYLWCFIFFTFKSFLISSVVIILLDLLVFYLIDSVRYDKISFYIMIIYLVWLVFASYLNFSIYLIN